MKNHLIHYLIIKAALLNMVIIFSSCDKKEPCPLVTTKSASLITQSTATLNGTINFYGQKSIVIFECGITTSYGQTMYPTNLNYGIIPEEFHFPLSGLFSGTTYHYRIKAEGKCGTTNGNDLSFTTLN